MQTGIKVDVNDVVVDLEKDFIEFIVSYND